MNEITRLQIARSLVDVIDRISTAVTSACIVASLLGSLLQADSLPRATFGGLAFFGLALVAGWLKAILDILIANAKEADAQ